MEPSLRSPPPPQAENPIPPAASKSAVTGTPVRSPPHPETKETISESLTLRPPILDSEHQTALAENHKKGPPPVTRSEVPSPRPQETKEALSESVTLLPPILDAEHHTAPSENHRKEKSSSFRSLLQEAEAPTASPYPVTGSAVRSPPRPEDTKEKPPERSSSFRSLLRKAEDPTASPSPARSPPREERTIGALMPLRSLLMAAEHRTNSPPPPTRHQNENSLSSASSFKSSHREAAEDPTASPLPQDESFALTVASVLSSPGADADEEGAAGAAAANRAVKRGAGTAASKGKIGGRGGRGGRVVRKPEAVARAAGWLRVSAVVLSMVSFSVMAADRTSGWAGDSFERYREFRYCFSINVIVFVYSSFQVFVQVYRMCTKQRIMTRRISYYFDFSMDQILAYLLMSASSIAASRNDEWVLSFGSDGFTKMMNGSIAMSFLAFFAVAFSSLISAHKLFGCNY